MHMLEDDENGNRNRINKVKASSVDNRCGGLEEGVGWKFLV